MTADARMILPVRVHAAFQIAFLSRVASHTLYARNLVGVRIGLDVRMAVAALETAVNARAELAAVDR